MSISHDCFKPKEAAALKQGVQGVQTLAAQYPGVRTPKGFSASVSVDTSASCKLTNHGADVAKVCQVVTTWSHLYAS